MPSSAISPTYSPGPWVSRIISWPSVSEMKTFTFPERTTNTESLESPSVMKTVFLG
jgi:hypothetical protein